MLFQEVSQALRTSTWSPGSSSCRSLGWLSTCWSASGWAKRALGLVASLAAGGAFVVAVLLALGLSASPEAKTVPFLDWITIGTLRR